MPEGQSCRNNTAKVNGVLQQSNKAAHKPNRLPQITLHADTHTHAHHHTFKTFICLQHTDLLYFQYGVAF